VRTYLDSISMTQGRSSFNSAAPAVPLSTSSFTYFVVRTRDSTPLFVRINMHTSGLPLYYWGLLPISIFSWDDAGRGLRTLFLPPRFAPWGPMGDIVPDDIEGYLDAHLAPRDSALAAVEVQGAREGWPIVGPAEGTFLHLLTRLVRARRALELGTAIGYSATWIARGLEAGGELVTIEGNPETARLAAENLKRTGVADRVRVLVGEAKDVVADLRGPFDLIFLDVDKASYPTLFPPLADRLRVGGLLVADNVLWSGAVVKSPADADTRAIRAYNDAVAADPRFASMILPLRDGVSVALRTRE